MIIVGREELDKFKRKHADVRKQIDSWEVDVKALNWDMPADVTSRYPKADVVGDNNIIFDFKWNRYRLWVKVSYKNKVVTIEKIGTHEEYETWVIV